MHGPYQQAGSLANYRVCDACDARGEFGKGQKERNSVLVHGEAPELGAPFHFS